MTVQNAPVKDTLAMTLVFISLMLWVSSLKGWPPNLCPSPRCPADGRSVTGEGRGGARGAHRLCSPPELVAPDEGLDKVPPPPEYWHSGANWRTSHWLTSSLATSRSSRRRRNHHLVLCYASIHSYSHVNTYHFEAIKLFYYHSVGCTPFLLQSYVKT